jgi:hypothetical protein
LGEVHDHEGPMLLEQARGERPSGDAVARIHNVVMHDSD